MLANWSAILNPGFRPPLPQVVVVLVVIVVVVVVGVIVVVVVVAVAVIVVGRSSEGRIESSKIIIGIIGGRQKISIGLVQGQYRLT